MPVKEIVVCYRKIINFQSKNPWEVLVFNDSYDEFRKQAPLYNPEKKHQTFAQLLRHNAGAEKLHFLVSASVINYLRQLNGLIPDIYNNLGQRFLHFENFKFEIINSHLHDDSQHQIAINFYTDVLIWHETIDDYLLVSEKNTPNENDIFLTHLFKLKVYLSIYSLKNIS